MGRPPLLPSQQNQSVAASTECIQLPDRLCVVDGEPEYLGTGRLAGGNVDAADWPLLFRAETLRYGESCESRAQGKDQDWIQSET